MRGLALALLCAIVLWLTHPAPPVAWFDTTYIAHRMLATPTFAEALAFAAGYHAFPRPARVLEWWLGAKLVGESATGYHAINVAFVGLAVWAVGWMARSLTGSAVRAVLVGGAMALSYVTVYPMLHFPYGVQVALALVGFAALVAPPGPWTRARTLFAVASILFAALAHEVFLTFTLVPWLYHRVVRPLPRWSVWACFAGMPVWLGIQLAFRTASTAGKGYYDGGAAEHVSRVVVSVLSGGLPAEMLRLVPIAPPFTRIRESLLSTPGLLLLLGVGLPTLVLLPWALRAPRSGLTRLLVSWLALGSLPLLLPVGTPEAYHLAGAMPALFLLWTEGYARLRAAARGRARLAAQALAGAGLLVWTAAHGYARAQTFHADLPLAGEAARSLREVIHAAELPIVALFPPAQVGGHYGYWPILPAERACVLEPTWVWRTSDLPSLPSACRSGDAVVAGPLDAAMERTFAGARAMLGHPTSSAFVYHAPGEILHHDPREILSVCALRGYEARREAGSLWWRYRLPASPEVRVVRLALAPRPAWVPVAPCAAGRP